jgi:hypothetical protein
VKNNQPGDLTRSDLELCQGQRKDSAAAVRIACKRYCEYFNDDDGEDGCGGYSTVLSGLRSGAINSSHLTMIVGSVPGPPRRMEILAQRLCAVCGYLADGCDYQSPSPPGDATPCGGYLLIQAMLDCGAVTTEDLEKILRGPRSKVQREKFKCTRALLITTSNLKRQTSNI